MELMSLAQKFDASSVNAIVLMGSHARGDAGPYIVLLNELWTPDRFAKPVRCIYFK